MAGENFNGVTTTKHLWHPNLVRNCIFTKAADIVNPRGLTSYPADGAKNYNCMASWCKSFASIDIKKRRRRGAAT